MTPARTSPRAALAGCAGILVAAAAVRLAPCWNDFWLDEIWSWFTAQQLDSALAVFTDVHHSNNNHLNTLWLYALGERDHWAIYRLPAFLAGVASVALAAALAWRRDRLEALFAALLVGACFALIHFSSEARGYAPAVAFALAALLLLELDLERRRPATALGFGTCVALGLLCHLVFLFFWAGALVWSGRRLWRAAPRPRAALLGIGRLHALPLAVLLGLAWIDLRHLEVGGGNPTDGAQLAARTVGFALGLPVVRALALPYALLAAALVGGGLFVAWRERDDRWLLNAVAIVAAPLVAIALLRPQVVAVRYFLIGIALTLLLGSHLLARAWRAGGSPRALAVALLAAYLLGNGLHTAAFLADGRGGYREALRFMARHTPGPEISVASDHDFRNGLVLRFYARELPAGRHLDYRPGGRRASGGSDWLVLHRAARPAAPPQSVSDAAGRRYALAAEFDHGAISGFWWAVYRNVRAGGVAPRRRSSTTPKPSPRKGSGPMRSIRSYSARTHASRPRP